MSESNFNFSDSFRTKRPKIEDIRPKAFAPENSIDLGVGLSDESRKLIEEQARLMGQRVMWNEAGEAMVMNIDGYDFSDKNIVAQDEYDDGDTRVVSTTEVVHDDGQIVITRRQVDTHSREESFIARGANDPKDKAELTARLMKAVTEGLWTDNVRFDNPQSVIDDGHYDYVSRTPEQIAPPPSDTPLPEHQHAGIMDSLGLGNSVQTSYQQDSTREESHNGTDPVEHEYPTENPKRAKRSAMGFVGLSLVLGVSGFVGGYKHTTGEMPTVQGVALAVPLAVMDIIR